MARYRRVNIDGKSLNKTETRICATDLLPGTFVTINGSEKFAQATAVSGRLYVINSASHQGSDIRNAIPKGDSGVGSYIEEGRELAILCEPGTYKKDTPITISSSGQGKVASSDTDGVIGYSQDEHIIESEKTDFIRVRMRIGTVATD